VPGALVAQEPAVVFEVLSKSTHWIDQSLKLRDYEATESIKYYVLISQEEPLVQVYRRDELGRFGVQSAVVLEGVDASIELPDFEVSIPFGTLYEGVQFPRRQRPLSSLARGEGKNAAGRRRCTEIASL
jgi:Uma2 family endonuclease